MKHSIVRVDPRGGMIQNAEVFLELEAKKVDAMLDAQELQGFFGGTMMAISKWVETRQEGEQAIRITRQFEGMRTLRDEIVIEIQGR